MPQNKLEDLKNHLFLCLQDLNDPEEGADFKKTIEKSKAVAAVGSQLVNAFKIELEAVKLAKKMNMDVKNPFIETVSIEGPKEPEINLPKND